MNIIKRSGAVERLVKSKIYNSIVNANNCVDEKDRLTQTQMVLV